MAYWRSQYRNAASGSSGVMGTALWRWVARSCRSRGKRTVRCPPTRAGGDERLPAVAPRLEVSLRDLLQGGLLQLGISQQSLEGGVLAFEIFETFGVLGLQPAELATPAVIRRLRDIQLSAHRCGVWPSASNRSAAITLRTICSALCLFPVAMILPSLPAHNTGRKTLTKPGSTNGGSGQQSTAELTAQCVRGALSPSTKSDNEHESSNGVARELFSAPHG